MTDKKHILTLDEALALIADGDEVHVFSNPAVNVLIGADWDREDLVAALRESKHIELAGPQATEMNHGVAFVHRNVCGLLQRSRRTRHDPGRDSRQARGV